MTLEPAAGWGFLERAVGGGTDHDTAAFAVQTVRRRWYAVRKQRYPDAQELTITADGGGSNGSRVRLWKWELQKLANEIGLPVRVHHFPPGTSKWNKIEHRLFSFITINWRGQPLISHKVMLSLTSNTTNASRLTVRAELDTAEYPLRVAITEKELDSICIERDDFHGEWNYTIKPNTNN